MAISIIHLPDELQQSTLSHVLADALVRDFFLSAPEWLPTNSNPSLDILRTVARLSAVCTLWRQLVYSILRRALSPMGSIITSPVVDQFPLWSLYRDTLRQLQAYLRDLRRTEFDLYRDIVNIVPTILILGTPPSPPPIPVPPVVHTPPTPPSAPLGPIPALVSLPPAAAPIALGPALVPHSTNSPLSTNPLFALAELHARADVFRRTYRGSGQPKCQVNQSLSINKRQAADALSHIRRARALLAHLNIDELAMALDRVLQKSDDDITLGLRACEWEETLQRLCSLPPWDQQAACEVYACLLEIERHVNAPSLPLFDLSRLGRMINITSRASHIVPVLVGKELIDCRAKADNISMDWMSLAIHFDGYF